MRCFCQRRLSACLPSTCIWNNLSFIFTYNLRFTVDNTHQLITLNNTVNCGRGWWHFTISNYIRRYSEESNGTKKYGTRMYSRHATSHCLYSTLAKDWQFSLIFQGQKWWHITIEKRCITSRHIFLIVLQFSVVPILQVDDTNPIPIQYPYLRNEHTVQQIIRYWVLLSTVSFPGG